VHLIRDPLSTATSWARLVSGYGAYSRNDLIVQGLEVWYAAHLRIMTIGQWNRSKSFPDGSRGGLSGRPGRMAEALCGHLLDSHRVVSRSSP